MGFKAQVVTEASASAAHFIGGSLKVNDAGGADQFLTRSGTSGNRRTYTWAGWVKRQQLHDKQTFMFAESDSSNQTSFGFNHSGATPPSGFYFRTEISATVTNAAIDASLRDTSDFYHIVVAVDTRRKFTADTRVTVYINGKLQTWDTSPGMGQDNQTFINHNVQQQLFAQGGVGDLDAYVSELYFVDGLSLGAGYFGFNDPLTNTWRPKKFKAEGTTVNDGTQWSSTIGDFTDGANVFDGNTDNQGYANNTGVTTLTTGKFVIKNNMRILQNFRSDGTYNLIINGVSINVPGTGTDSTAYRWSEVDLSSLQLPIVVTSLQYDISQTSGNSIKAIEVDNNIMTDSTTTNIDFGTNGFYLPLDVADFEKDKSGKGNDWTKNDFSSGAGSENPDVPKESPSGATFPDSSPVTTTSSNPSNYCIMNRNDQKFTDNGSFSEGMTKYVQSSTDGRMCRGTIGVSSGKWYWEWKNLGGNNSHGISKQGESLGTYAGGTANSYAYFVDGDKYNVSGSSYGDAIGTNDIVGTALDMDAGTLTFYLNNVSQGVAFSGLSGTYYPAFGSSNVSVVTFTTNFGTKPFTYAPPDGFLPLSSANVRPETVITRPDQYVGAAVWTVPSGNADTRIVTPFKPDLVMAKNRSGTDGGSIYNSVSGDSKFQRIFSTSDEMNDAETTSATRFDFNHNGFTFEANNDNANHGSGDLSVAWYWKAGGGKSGGGGFFKDDVEYASAAAAGLSGGSLTVTASSVGTKQGFSIIHYEGNGSSGATVSHGLSQTPDLFFIACRDITNGNYYDTWHSGYYVSGGSGKNYMRLRTADGAKYASDMFQTPTSSVVTLGSSSSMNGNGNDYTLYCWHDVPGFQKFGTYEGNNNSNGPFVHLGFNPAIIWTKSMDGNGKGWEVHWNSGPRLRENPQSERLMLNETAAKATSNHVDFLSDGFKIRNTFSGMNNASETWLYCAWADVPTSNMYGAQTNAR